MRRLLMPAAILVALLATACTRSPSTGSSPNVSVAPNVGGGQTLSSTGWVRPMDVTPLTNAQDVTVPGGKAQAGEGKFDIISDTPWPGEKVRVFFFGVQA